MTHLDYANGLLIGIPDIDITRIQRIQNMAAKLVLVRRKRDSATRCLKDLHWLPIHLRIQYKIIVMVFKCLHNLAPDYLSIMIRKPNRARTTRASQDETLLAVPPTKLKTFADRSFSVAGPKLWNQLPLNLRTLSTLDAFKAALKTFLFTKF